MVVQLLFCGVLLPGFVQDSMQHSYVGGSVLVVKELNCRL